MDSFEALRPGGSGILPEETPPKFFARHLSAYYFVLPYIINKDILELGFGDGYGSNFMKTYAKSVTAVDSLEKNVNLASNKYKKPGLEFIEMDGASLDFTDETFDVVISFQVIEHIQENRLEKYLEGIKRVLKRNGTAFISTLNLTENKKPQQSYTQNPFHIKEFTFEEFYLLIRKVFSTSEIQGLFYGGRLRFYERLKKIGIFRFLPRPINIVDRFYDNITVNDFVWRKGDLDRCIDFMAICGKI